MVRLVLDACAILAYVNDEPGAEIVERLLLDESNECLSHAINVVEVYYQTSRKSGKPTAERMLADLDGIGLTVREDFDPRLRVAAGDLRVIVLESPGARRSSLADVICAALAEREGCEVVTSDLHDFQPLVDAGRCRIRRFRQ